MPQLLEALQYQFLGNEIRIWLTAALVCLLTLTLLPLARQRVSLIVQGAARQHPGMELLLRLIVGTNRMFLTVAAVYAGERMLLLPAPIERFSTIVMLIAVWLQIGRWALIVLDQLIDRERRRRGSGDAAFASSVTILRFIASVFLWALVLLLALDNLGVDITALVAGLGIGGIAVALAVQTVLKDLLGSLTIALDRPFVVGDALTLDKVSGKVEHIGVRSTRLRSADGEQIVVANADLLQARLRNFGRMEERRGVMRFAIAYDTPPAKVKEVNGIVERIIRAQPGMRFERCHFQGFAAHGLKFEAVFFAVDAEMDALLAAQQSINLELLSALGDRNIALAYPMQRVLLEAGY